MFVLFCFALVCFIVLFWIARTMKILCYFYCSVVDISQKWIGAPRKGIEIEVRTYLAGSV